MASQTTWESQGSVKDALAEAQGYHDEARQKRIMITLSIAMLVCAVPTATALHVVPHFVQDHPLPRSLLFDVVCTSAVFFAVWHLFHVCYCGLSFAFKVATVLFWLLCILTLDITFDKVPWYFNISFLLILCVLLESEKDKTLMNVLSVAVCVVTVVYVALRALANGGVLSYIDQNEQCPCSEIRIDAVVIITDWTASVFPIMCNFAFVKMYSHIARRQMQAVNSSVEAASLIANKLANFDLDAADDLLAKADSTSPIHKPLSTLLQNLRSYRSFLPFSLFSHEEHSDPPNAIIGEALQGRSTSWEHAAMAIQRLREPAYSLGDFTQDVSAAFPELQLYSLEDRCSSGHTGFEEYQRTMGAMYALYCLARLDVDGKELLSFGVDADWKPRMWPHGDAAEKMEQFYYSMDWEALTSLLVSANLLIRDDFDGWVRQVSHLSQCSARSSRVSQLQLNHDRMMAMLVLTAIHDIMKNARLLPTVQERHAPYNSVAAGDEIMDHDTALAYVLEHFPSLLPSYHGLEAGQRAPILFTQGKMGFNNGWLVQGEAPPGALFSKFKQVVTEGCANESDISFYFTHWLTDLAGAEPFGLRPWPGAEKFVATFPLRVLNAFLESFSFVEHLATRSEVEVMEHYLESRWRALGPSRPLVEEADSLAAMRLALMAQGFEIEVVDALLAMQQPERDLIAAEMARTGCRQQFRHAPAAVLSQPAGPALLIYYAPALLQKAGATQAAQALKVLAAVYQAARLLFPLHPAAAEKTAVIRVDALKALSPTEIASAGPWHLQRMSHADAVVVSEGMQGQDTTRDGGPASIVKIPLDHQVPNQYPQLNPQVASQGASEGGKRVQRL